jgi:6-phosphogluconolactonase (cycloisomerase 2 family)
MTRHVSIATALGLLLVAVAHADTFVYVSVAAEKRIAVYHLDAETGKLTHRSDFKVEEGEPGALTVTPDRRYPGCKRTMLSPEEI